MQFKVIELEVEIAAGDRARRWDRGGSFASSTERAWLSSSASVAKPLPKRRADCIPVVAPSLGQESSRVAHQLPPRLWVGRQLGT